MPSLASDAAFGKRPPPTPLALIALAPQVSLEAIAPLAHAGICVCDSYVVGAESWDEVPGGWAQGRFLNVDHHAPVPRMARRVSSANLAIERVDAVGLAEGTVVITHTDCDSILSAGIMTGRLAPLDAYGTAAIAADHTGVADPIADLLQALDPRRDVEASYDALARLEAGRPQPDDVREALDARLARRAAAADAVARGLITVDAGLATGVLERSLDGEFFPALLPEAEVIVVCSPWPSVPGRWEVKVRLGQAARDGQTLDELPWTSVDPAQLGRWNARANKRGGGTTVTPDAYLEKVRTMWHQHRRQ